MLFFLFFIASQMTFYHLNGGLVQASSDQGVLAETGALLQLICIDACRYIFGFGAVISALGAIYFSFYPGGDVNEYQ